MDSPCLSVQSDVPFETAFSARPDGGLVPLALGVPTTGFMLADASKRQYWKEVIYADHFVKRQPDGSDFKFSVDLRALNHWRDTTKSMLANGVDIPMPLEHTNDPTKNRAFVRDARTGVNAKGLANLEVLTEFVDAEAEKLAASCDVSVFVLPEYKDGKGNHYRVPIRHVAFTNYPVIPGLEKFQSIAASADLGGYDPMAVSAQLTNLATKIGLNLSAATDDSAATDLIVSAFAQLRAKTAQPQPGQPGGAPPTPTGAPAAHPAAPAMGGASDAPGLPAGVLSQMSSLMAENRTNVLGGLVRAGNITKACHDDLVKSWCAPEQIALGLSEAHGKAAQDAFTSLVESLKKNTSHSPGQERTGPNSGVLALSDGLKGEGGSGNAVTRNAERRAAAAKA